MVPQIHQVQMPIVAQDIVQCKRLPVLALAEQTVQEEQVLSLLLGSFFQGTDFEAIQFYLLGVSLHGHQSSASSSNYQALASILWLQ